MVKLKVGNNTNIPLGEGMSILSIHPCIVFNKMYRGVIVLKKYSKTESKLVPTIQKIKVKKQKEVDLLPYKDFFIKYQNNLTDLDIEVSEEGELFYDEDQKKEYPSGWTEAGKSNVESCPGCGTQVQKGDLMKHLMSGECKRE